jgi:hypothetical protein
MTKTMVERVAAVIMRGWYPSFVDWDQIPDNQDIAGIKATSMSVARAAIAAMREPTFMMRLAGEESRTVEDGGVVVAIIDIPVDTPWRAMIDAALAEDQDTAGGGGTTTTTG